MTSPYLSFHLAKVLDRNPEQSNKEETEPHLRTHRRAAVGKGVHADGPAHLVRGEGRRGGTALVQLLMGWQVLALLVLTPCSLDTAANTKAGG